MSLTESEVPPTAEVGLEEALERIDRLMSQIGKSNNGRPRLEAELVQARYEAFAPLKAAADTKPTVLPPVADGDPLPTHGGIPIVDASEMTGALIRKGILQGGATMVRGLFDPETIESIRGGIDKSLGAMAKEPREPRNSWYQPYSPEQEFELNVQRHWAVDCGAMLASDSPRVLFEVLAAYERSGVVRVINEYLGERPAISMKKTVLRRVDVDIPADWHQDGAFMGDSLFSLNVWTTLTDCGKDAPGLDLVPARLDALVETGTEGAHFDWSVAPAAVVDAAGDTPLARPDFKAGDVVFFDEFCMHRTGADAAMTDRRYAVEMWSFAPSRYPGTQIPLVI